MSQALPRSIPPLGGAILAWIAALPTPSPAQASSVAERQAAWQEHARMEADSRFKDRRWRALGPRLQGGRIEAIAVHPKDPDTFYVGPGSGNLWKTTNRGTSWTPVFENESTFTVGSVAIAAANPDIVWVGSGETQPRHSGYSYPGTGVFKSVDGGATWQNMGLWDTHHIGKVVIDPRNPDVVFVAAIGHFWSASESRGVFKTTDGGRTWRKVLFVSGRTGVVDLVMDPRQGSVLYAAAWQVTAGPESGIYKSVDGGETWQRLTRGLPAGSTGRAGIDLCRSRPDVVYVFLDNHVPRAGARGREIAGAEVYRSDDSGGTWRKVNTEDLWEVFTIYGWKFCDVRVVPDDPDELFILGNRVYHSKDGGRTFARIGEQILRLHDTRGEVMHLDHHDLHIDPADPDRLLLGNDGGLFASYDRGASWLHLNNLPIGEFYFVAVDDRDPFRIYGGTQDNASLYGPSDQPIEPFRNDPWRHVFLDQWTGGDGFVTLPDPTDPDFVYYEHQHGAMRRIDTRGPVLTRHGRPVAPKSERGQPRLRFGWYTPFLISPHDPRTLYVGGNQVCKSTDRGEHWRRISPDLADAHGSSPWAVVPTGAITMLDESVLRRGLLYAGTEGGGLHMTRDDGGSWHRIATTLPKKWVSRVIASRHQEGRLYVAQQGYREDDFRAYLYTSDDFGATVRPITGNLPMQSIHVVREDPADPETIYVGTDLGVHVSLDRGKVWHALSATLPTTPVHDLVVHPRTRHLVAATHGRSVFILDPLDR